MNKQDLQLVFDLIRVVFVTGVLVIMPAMGASATMAIAALSAILVITYLGYMIMYWKILQGEDLCCLDS